jgi:arylsulfatase A-like enzyme
MTGIFIYGSSEDTKVFLKTIIYFKYINNLIRINKYLLALAISLFLFLLFIFLCSWFLSKKFNYIKFKNALYNAYKKRKQQKLIIFYIILWLILNIFGMIYKKINTPNGPNIIFLTVDTLRADHLLCYGYFRHTTPQIDKLKKDSIIFNNMICVMSHTRPSYVSMFTGLYPKTHNVLSNNNFLRKKLLTITEILNNQNYVTVGFIGGSVLYKAMNLSQGFDLYDDNLNGNREIRAEEVNNKVIKWIKENKNENFFLFVHFFDPHAPYDPLPPFDRAFDYSSDSLRQYLDINCYNENNKEIAERLRKIDLYDGEVKYVDREIGKLISLLKELELYEESLIILTADHGESLGEHNWWGHELNYEDQIRIPFLIKTPFSELKNLVINEQTQNLDIMHFILKVSESKLTKGNAKRIISDALKSIKKREYAFVERRSYSERSKIKYPDLTSKGAEYAIRTKKWKLIFKEGDEDELYNLSEDPNELNNVIMGNREKAKSLLKTLKSWINKDRIKYKQEDLSDKDRRLLKSLGYID